MQINKTTEGGRLRREMSYIDLSFAGLGAIIGSGWLFGVLYAANYAGPAAILAWIIAAIIVTFIALVYAELSGMLPEAGGITRFPHFSHGSLVGFIMSWGAFLGYAAVPAIEAEAVVQYAEHYITSFQNNKSLDFVVEAIILLIFYAINIYGVKVFAKINSVVTFLKFITPTLTIIVILFVAKHWGNYTATTTHGSGFMPYGSAGVFIAISSGGIIFSLLGFRQAVDMAGEAKNPQRDVPRAIITAILLGALVYTLVQVVFIAALPPDAIAKGWAALAYTSPFAQVATIIGLGWLASILYADAVLSPSGTGLVYLSSGGRVVLGSARNNYLGNKFRSVSERFGVPIWAMSITVLFAIIFLLPFPSWQSLVGVISSATAFTYVMGPVSLAVFRKYHNDKHRPFRLGGAKVLGLLAFIGGTLIIYWSGWGVDWKLVVGILGGTIIYLIASVAGAPVQKITREDWKSGIWLPIYLLSMLAIAYFGAARFGAPFNHGKGFIHYPYDIVVDIIVAIIFYTWAVASGRNSEETEQAFVRAADLRRGNQEGEASLAD
ncbi:APC family permease [Ferrimicrobium sp.]|uniref:APC family permease n=1 Tax=Ferrimicrobium sp. TaxID=2926050 RepID=UPI0026283BDF|nr:APC family permease [Ferrimicrobium sp.]